jgi:hypothetical protein
MSRIVRFALYRLSIVGTLLAGAALLATVGGCPPRERDDARRPNPIRPGEVRGPSARQLIEADGDSPPDVIDADH